MRKLIDVIDEMLSVIPKKEKYLISFLEDIKCSEKCRAPEDSIGWWQISNELDNTLSEIEDIPKLFRKLKVPSWKLKLFSTFTMQSLEEIKKDIYG